MKTEFDWNDGAYVPDKDGYYLCEVSMMRYSSKYLVCRWYNYGWYLHSVNNGRSGWYRLVHNVKRWTLIEEN